jgi:hypothetical protein
MEIRQAQILILIFTLIIIYFINETIDLLKEKENVFIDLEKEVKKIYYRPCFVIENKTEKKINVFKEIVKSFNLSKIEKLNLFNYISTL